MMQNGFNSIVTLKPSEAGKLMQYPLRHIQETKIFVPPLDIKQDKPSSLTFRLKNCLKTAWRGLFKKTERCRGNHI